MKYLAPLVLIVYLLSCDADPETVPPNEQLGSLPSTITAPLDNPTTEEKVTLGRMLFWDPILSGEQDVACVTCHHPANGYAEHIDLSIGVGGFGLSDERDFGVLIKRNAPTVINTAFNGINTDGFFDPSDTVMFWDNRASSLEEQALEPIKSGDEMRGALIPEEEILAVVSQRLSDLAEYRSLFLAAYGDEEVNPDRIAKALAAFQRTIVANNSRFDRFARGDDSALSTEEIRGLNAFMDAGCAGCHGGPMLSDFRLHELPVEHNPKLSEVDSGAMGRFRTPSLRNVALTAPYMHNGTVATLIDAITFYDDIENPGNDPRLADVDMGVDPDATAEAIEAFLHTLTDESFDATVPASVPSGLNPGGNI